MTAINESPKGEKISRKNKTWNKKKTIILSSILFALNSFSALAEEKKDDIKISGQLQSRFEVDERDFNYSTSPYFPISLKTKLGFEKSFDKVKFFAQIRDSRMMGEELSPVANFKNLDLQQGYVSFEDIFDSKLSLQAGRFELNYGTQRFLGAANWHYVGRSFDGGKINYANKDLYNLNIDLFHVISGSATPFIGTASPKVYQDLDFLGSANKEKELTQLDQKLYGFWSSIKFCPEAEIDLFGFMDDNRSRKNSVVDVTKSPKEFKQTLSDKKQFTVGLNHKGTYGSFSSLIEGAYQVGKNQQTNLKTNAVEIDDNLSAYLASAQLFFAPISEFKIGLGADIISGDPNGKVNGAFETMYGTNHLFYGGMDYFINGAKDTKNLGLNDFYVTTVFKKDNFPLSANLAIHHINSNQPNKAGLNTFGQEADLIVKYQVSEKSLVSLGGSAFMQGNLMKNDAFWGSTPNNISYWSYVMLTHNL